VSVSEACAALGVPRATYYRQQKPQPQARSRPPSPRALSPVERQGVLETLHAGRFADKAPGEVYATLLDEDIYLCSPRTMYRILEANKELQERRAQLRHPNYAAPELLATGPNQVWSWDITKLRGPVKWSYFHLYVLLDIFSRYVVGWTVANAESAKLAERLIQHSLRKQQVAPGQLVIHADRGAAMTSQPVAALLARLDVTKSHSRPRVSNDNPFSEAQFKTLKYHPTFPGRFGSIEDALTFCRSFFPWYNTEHRHSGIAMLTPESVHYGTAADVLARRRAVLSGAYQANPERFPRGVPLPPPLPSAAWINPPKSRAGVAEINTPQLHAARV
jgi:putative transposase